MFIEHENPKDLLAPAERNGLAYHCRKHRAPLERRSCSQTVSINIWLRWSQNTIWLRPRPRCGNSGFSAPKARNVTAWAIGPGGVWLRFLALKARNESGTSEILKVFSRDSLFRAFSASGIVMTFTQGVALGYHIPRLWR